jgi:ubiquinone/menaquinone biosynthesis C-methylase UbiE
VLYLRSPCAVEFAIKLGFVEGNAERLPFPDDSFDLYTIAFGLRNVTNKDVSPMSATQQSLRVLTCACWT